MGIPILTSDIQQSDLFKVRYTINEPSITFTAIKFSPNGENFACSSSNGKIYIYNTTTGKLVTTLSGHTKGISDIVYSPINSNILASCSDDLTIRLWNITQQRCIKILRKHTYHITTLKFTQKGNILISGSSDETITIWDIASNGGKILTTLAAHSDPVSSIALTPDDSIIVSASYDGLMRLFDLQTSQCLKTLTNSTFGGHGTATASTNDVLNFPIAKVELSPNGQFILNSSLDGKIRLWNYMENKVYKTYQGLNGEKICEKFNCDIKFITRNVNNNNNNGISGDGDEYNNVLIVSGSDSTGLLIWDIQSKQIVYQVDPQMCGKDAILGVDTYNQGEILGCCSRDGRITILDMNQKYIDRNENQEPQQKEVESRGETPI
ncbi:subunit of the COMPASS complex, putative [Candida dubliniensis CD36]|uniref:Subunit of the COMPASS complex, putative n=1 Tax=Candida dubliniensis (strain CD36 / ATCC MYA-646 / CBS 7987 / NCPF 3949 / NRRL Y-17841) TaxID=573826 RepID=B9WIT0_CANDC|nr:subunit of the COMPASS complex, putative [Candida dubliniensis CD36]CAX41148.1 subunit of the COMPASS complex, putative [Candida dubliniensis CD36]